MKIITDELILENCIKDNLNCLAFWWSPQPWIQISKTPCLIRWCPQHRHRKEKIIPMISLWFIFSAPGCLNSHPFLMCCLCFGFVEHFLGIFTLIVQNWSTWLSQFLEKQVVCYCIKKAFYSVWNKWCGNLSCVAILGEKICHLLSVPVFTLEGGSQWECIHIWTILELYPY